MSPCESPVQLWDDLQPGDRVLVSQPGKHSYPARIDLKTADSNIIWVIDHGGSRMAFDHREGIRIVHDDGTTTPQISKT